MLEIETEKILKHRSIQAHIPLAVGVIKSSYVIQPREKPIYTEIIKVLKIAMILSIMKIILPHEFSERVSVLPRVS